MSLHKCRIAVIGASGQVGRVLLKILAEHRVPITQVVGLASNKSHGKVISYGDDATIRLSALNESTHWGDFDIVFFAAGSKVSAKWAPVAAAAGCFVVDKSSHFRLQPHVPLIIPEVNECDIPQGAGIVSTPNCVAIPLMIVLNALQQYGACEIRSASISTYQSVSGAGQAGMQALDRQTGSHHINALTDNQNVSGVSHSIFAPHAMAFNVIPCIGELDASTGVTGEESKIVAEVRKVMGIPTCITCVRVPVFIGHCMSVHLTCADDIHIKVVRDALSKEPAIVLDNPHACTTPVDCAGNDSVHVSRVRSDGLSNKGLMFWIACDNLRKGAALNAVQIAEYYAQRHDPTQKGGI